LQVAGDGRSFLQQLDVSAATVSAGHLLLAIETLKYQLKNVSGTLVSSCFGGLLLFVAS
jgi:hypothetical protein